MRGAIFARLLERGTDARDVEILRLSCKGITQDGIGETLGLSQSVISKRLASVGFREIGYAFEDVWSAKLTREGIPHIKEGDNSPQPDIVVNDENGKPIEVISCKCYRSMRPSVTIGFSEIAASELEMRDEHQIPLNLLFYDIVANKLHAKVLVTDQKNFTFRRKTK